MSVDRTFPAALAEVSRVSFPYAGGGGVDFEPREAFVEAQETLAWFRLWTGNAGLDGPEFLVFGEDGTGGSAAVWVCREGRPLREQPVVFLGSEGETGVVAASLDDFLWLLADGSGPCEAVAYPDRASRPREDLLAIAERHSATARSTAAEVVARAAAEFPDFDEMIFEMTR